MGEQSVLVVAAHPDDEILGAGATMATHTANGDRVHVLLLGEGQTSRFVNGQNPEGPLRELRAAAVEANRAVGAEVSFGDFPDNRFDTVPLLELVRVIETKIRRVEPQVIYTHHVGDLNIDHQLTCRAVITASRPMGGDVPDILSFEVRSSTDWADPLGTAPPFRPNVWLVVNEEAVQAKFDALAAYSDEMRPWPHSRSLQAIGVLLSHRGAQIGADSAEAFSLLRCRRGWWR